MKSRKIKTLITVGKVFSLLENSWEINLDDVFRFKFQAFPPFPLPCYIQYVPILREEITEYSGNKASNIEISSFHSHTHTNTFKNLVSLVTEYHS